MEIPWYLQIMVGMAVAGLLGLLWELIDWIGSRVKLNKAQANLLEQQAEQLSLSNLDALRKMHADSTLRRQV
jgi:hypothetical protein